MAPVRVGLMQERCELARGSVLPSLHHIRRKREDFADLPMAALLEEEEDKNFPIDLTQVVQGLTHEAAALIAGEAVAWRGSRINEAALPPGLRVAEIKAPVTLSQDTALLGGKLRAVSQTNSLEQTLPEPECEGHALTRSEEPVQRQKRMCKRLLHQILGIDPRSKPPR